MLRSIPLSLSWKKTAGEMRTPPLPEITRPSRLAPAVASGPGSTQGLGTGPPKEGTALGDNCVEAMSPPVQGSGKSNGEDGRCWRGGESREHSVRGRMDVCGVDAGPGRRQSGCGSPRGQETGQEGGRRPRGRRKSGGRTGGRGGGGGRKPGSGEGLPRCTCVPWGHRGRAWALGEGAPAVPAMGPKLPRCRERALPWAANASPPPLGLQATVCPAAATCWDSQPHAGDPATGSAPLPPQRHPTQRLCAGGRTPGSPLRQPARRCCCPWGFWLGFDPRFTSPRGRRGGFGGIYGPLDLWEHSGVLSPCSAQDGATTEQRDTQVGGGQPAQPSLLPPHPQLLGNIPVSSKGSIHHLGVLKCFPPGSPGLFRPRAMLWGGDVSMAGGVPAQWPPARCKAGWSGGGCRPSGCRFDSRAEDGAVKYL